MSDQRTARRECIDKRLPDMFATAIHEGKGDRNNINTAFSNNDWSYSKPSRMVSVCWTY